MRIDILTILPGLLHGYLQEGMIGRAIRERRLKVNLVNIRDFSRDKHRKTDDAPYGGGPGLVMSPEPLAAAVSSLPKPRRKVILMSAQGTPFCAEKARHLAKQHHLALVCGRYEGLDQRFIDHYVDEEISIGDYVLTGGELAALVVMDAVARFVPGVLGNEASAESESFSEGLLEYPQYTRPLEFEGEKVPEVLLGGNHAAIDAWRREQAQRITRHRRPDLIKDRP